MIVWAARKLKCDGGRPACGQCTKRSNSCDYMPQTKRRGARQRKGDESESESAEDKSADPDEPSPESSTQKRSTNVKPEFQQPLPPLGQMHELRGDMAPIPSSSRSKLPMPPAEPRPPFFNELPHIATLSLPDPSPATPAPMSAPSLPPIRPASEQQAAQRRRSATLPGKTGRPSSGSGPKVVACNFCRGISLTY